MKQYIKEDQFAPGSMLPKVQACIEFVEARPEGKAIITSLENIENLLANEAGTIIISLIHNFVKKYLCCTFFLL